jgi:4-aminobutyrate aminotransferase-like enzyme
LDQWKKSIPQIGDVRGLGPMQAIEFVKDPKTKEPNKELSSKVAKYCYENGVVAITAGTFGNVIRILVPLTISQEELEEGLKVIKAQGTQESLLDKMQHRKELYELTDYERYNDLDQNIFNFKL